MFSRLNLFLFSSDILKQIMVLKLGKDLTSMTFKKLDRKKTYYERDPSF